MSIPLILPFLTREVENVEKREGNVANYSKYYKLLKKCIIRSSWEKGLVSFREQEVEPLFNIYFLKMKGILRIKGIDMEL